MMTNREKRDFIAKEITKRIIGPGYAEGVFLCNEEATDEILEDRPVMVYTGGVLYPKEDKNLDETEDTVEVENIDVEADNNIVEEVDDDNDDSSKNSNSDNQLNLGIADRADFKPSHIGLVVCVADGTQTIDIDVRYGIYHVLNDSEKKDDNLVCEHVKVKLGYCSLEQLKKTFAYYDSYNSLKNELYSYGAKCMEDLFLIDEDNLTISPRRIFKFEDANGKQKFLKASAFPELPRNKVVSVLIKLFINPTRSVDMPINMSKESVLSEIGVIQNLDLFKPILDANDWSNISDNITIDGEYNTIRITNGIFTKPADINLYNILYVDDPVKNHLLPRLLQFWYFKREQKYLQTYSLPITERTGCHLLQDTDDSLQIRWKVMERTDQNGLRRKYVKVLLENIKKRLKKQQFEDYIHQAELKISSPNIISYSEPHRSSIADDEYDVNETLYSDIKVYAKGVNCGVEWNVDSQMKEVRTTYAPSQLAVAFNPKSDIEEVRMACDVFDLTIWSKVSKEDILARFYSIAGAYNTWHKLQREEANGNKILNGILTEQEEFYKRLVDNINYLRDNNNAYNCFKLANTAMYIQMTVSRDSYFKKDRDYSAIPEGDCFDDALWERFRQGDIRPEYRPFQLAFLLMNVKSTFEEDDPYRNDNVDLIWFPTGGGKTEAYLALTALTIAKRRLVYPKDNGISVIMRYTLRLLTAQQFERASFLICALEFLRKNLEKRQEYKEMYSLGTTPITLGMWIGSSSTPNKYEHLNVAGSKYRKYHQYLGGGDTKYNNPFPISYCPWCGCKLVQTPVQGNQYVHGYGMLYDAAGTVHCINNKCGFKEQLPIMFIDEQLYSTPPTILFATVDKFAGINRNEVGRMFGCNEERSKPDLIIQDELHLISGPLGSLVGMFETMIEEVCTERDANGKVLKKPKIITSTATTRNTQNLIKQLYNRDVRSFPVSGIKYSDNFFSKKAESSEEKRRYVGYAPTGHSASELEIRTIAAQIVAKEKLIVAELHSAGIDLMDYNEVARFLLDQNNNLRKDIDNYWSLVLYYTNLKSLGRACSRMGQEIKSNAESMREYLDAYPALSFICDNFHLRAEEFTSRQESSRIKELLVVAENQTSMERIHNSKMRVSSKMDIVQATNMISVGIDIARWNTMIVVGQPLTTADYIQSSSRVGRTYDGLVVNLYNPLNARELSLYENYVPYHTAFYKFVEPLMVTAFTEQTIDKLINNIFLCYMGAIKGYQYTNNIRQCDVERLQQILKERLEGIQARPYSDLLANMIIKKVNNIYVNRVNNQTMLLNNVFNDRELMSSLRDVESDTYIYYNEE